MRLEELIKKLEEARKACKSNWEKKNIVINIKICEMQIKIRDRNEKIRGL